LAVELGRRHDGPVTFVATLDPFDDDLRARVTEHRRDRPDWPTVEAPLDLGDALRVARGLAIVDCLTVWVGNLVERGDTDVQIVDAAEAAADVAAARDGSTVVVTNEVGLGVHPATAVGRRYRDVLGRVNQAWGRRADRTLLLVAGRAIRLEDPFALLT
jgi:adenosyl cobinamide kinase/adenosyl cobinamide phosphate guanylyltransferase